MKTVVETTRMALSDTLEKWRKSIARPLGIPALWVRQAADLLSAVPPYYKIPHQTYRNWIYERRTPSMLAQFEIVRRTKVVQDHATGKAVTPELAQVIATIQQEHAESDGTGEEE